MKKIILPITFIVLSMIVESCSIKSKDGVDGLSLKDCYSDRKNQETISNIEVVIKDIADQLMLTPTKDDSQRYAPCNIPKGYKNGDKLIVTLTLKEIYPQERWAGSPCLLTMVELIK